MKKSYLFLILLLSGLALSACTQQTAKTPQSITLTQTDSTQPPSDTNSDKGALSDSGNTKTNNTNTNPTQKGSSMKTIKDFEPIKATQATLKTTKGDIVIELYRDKAPLTTLNFLNLAQDGFYNGIVFHRVIENFMAQVGDPLTKEPGMGARWGTGGPGYAIADEFDPELKHDQAGIVSMANSGPNTGGSQFFITHEATPWLDGKHAVFGHVTAGLDNLMEITKGDKILEVILN